MSNNEFEYRKSRKYETKQMPTFIKQHDEVEGIVEHFVAIFGNRDDGGDVILPGSFRKTLVERGRRVKVLDQHGTDSVLRVVGKPLALQEVGQDGLTAEVLQYAPDATGGLLATTQYAIKTQRGKDVFELVRGGFLPETSIGYDAIQVDYKKQDIDGKEQTTRYLKEIRLWEYSNVVWGMNPGTATVSAKEAEPTFTEAKPYGVHKRDGKFCVYKHDPDGEPTGDTLGCHDTEDEAQAQVRALYASEEDGGKAAEPEPETPKTIDDELEAIWAAIRELKDHAPVDPESAEQQAAQDTQAEEQAGPDGDESPAPPTSEVLLRRIQLEQERLQLLEV